MRVSYQALLVACPNALLTELSSRPVSEMSAEDAASFLSLARAGQVRCWVMGGWGVDALLGAQTRTHHDLDLLVLSNDLPVFDAVATSAGFSRAYLWDDENDWVEVSGAAWPTAFVMSDAAGRELDIHAADVEGGCVTPRCAVPWTFPDGALDGVGVIGRTAVACLSINAQLGTHQGYELPENHVRDLQLLMNLQESQS